MPNILLLTVLLASLAFISLYIRNNGLGLFFRTGGIVILILGIIIFIFFLSIDPGYGWTRSIDLTKNYIMIFTAMAVAMAGIVLIVTGQHMNELRIQARNKIEKCRQLVAGNAAALLEKDWYSLRDQGNKDLVSVYLFQKKSDRNKYRIIATLQPPEKTFAVSEIVISSQSIPHPITLNRNNSPCPGVFEKNISINFDTHHEPNEQIRFDLLIKVAGYPSGPTESKRHEASLQFTLENTSHGDLEGNRQTRRVVRNRGGNPLLATLFQGNG